MNQAIYTAKSGIFGQQARLDVIGNNIANVNTAGYKVVRADFKDALYQTLRRPVQPQDHLNLELGHGVILSATTRDFRVGSIQDTGNMTDLMLVQEGTYFAVSTIGGETHYTRNGAFLLSNEPDGLYLTTGNGEYLLDVNGDRIKIPDVASTLTVDAEGNVSSGDNPPVTKIGIYRFDNTSGLEAVGDSGFIPNEVSGEARLVPTGGERLIRQGAIEMSNVELANEMSRMIRTQRAFQLSSRALTTADQMAGLAVNLRRS